MRDRESEWGPFFFCIKSSMYVNYIMPFCGMNSCKSVLPPRTMPDVANSTLLIDANHCDVGSLGVSSTLQCSVSRYFRSLLPPLPCHVQPHGRSCAGRMPSMSYATSRGLRHSASNSVARPNLFYASFLMPISPLLPAVAGLSAGIASSSVAG